MRKHCWNVGIKRPVLSHATAMPTRKQRLQDSLTPRTERPRRRTFEARLCRFSGTGTDASARLVSISTDQGAKPPVGEGKAHVATREPGSERKSRPDKPTETSCTRDTFARFAGSLASCADNMALHHWKRKEGFSSMIFVYIPPLICGRAQQRNMPGISMAQTRQPFLFILHKTEKQNC